MSDAPPVDPALLRVFENLLDAIAEEMGSALERTGYSPNIKERRDYSCALFDARGDMIAQAAHNPVHLGSTPLSVEAAIHSHEFGPGDVVLLNDPYLGGTHLPDLTMVSAVFEEGATTPIFYVANRAHHADVGGAVRGSMALFTDIYQEGLRLPPILYCRSGEVVPDIERILLANMRQPAERRGDLRAQLNANRVGEKGLRRLLATLDRSELLTYCGHLQDAAEKHVRALLTRLPDGVYRGQEYLESDGTGSEDIMLCVEWRVDGSSCHLDFAGTATQVRGSVNTNPAVVISAIFYVLRALAGSDIPANAGCLRPVTWNIPHGCCLNPHIPAAVAGGNVETSQRLVDLLLSTLATALPDEIPAQSQGTMNNMTLGSDSFSYYETIGGGTGAGPWGGGTHARHSHMTNTRNTPIEALEHALPVRVMEYSIRRGSGGVGKHAGGDGIIRELHALATMQAALLTERRRRAPQGLHGGGAGECGLNLRIQSDGSREELPAKWLGELEEGMSLRLETPGGGAWGCGGRSDGVCANPPDDPTSSDSKASSC